MDQKVADRKEQLKALARLKRKADDRDEGEEIDAAEVVRFRNYTPSDKSTEDQVQKVDKILSQVDTIQEEIDGYKREAMEAEAARPKELDIQNLQPKKPDFDLKRDLEKKLEKLNKKTKVAVAQIIRERLKEKGQLA